MLCPRGLVRVLCPRGFCPAPGTPAEFPDRNKQKETETTEPVWTVDFAQLSAAKPTSSGKRIHRPKRVVELRALQLVKDVVWAACVIHLVDGSLGAFFL